MIATADPAGNRELRQATVFGDKPETYTAPVLANARIDCRRYEDDVVCLQLNP